MMIHLQTERLILCDHTPEDLDDYYRLFSNETSMFYLPKSYLKSVDEAKKQLDIIIADSEVDDRQRYFLCIKDKQSGAYIGEIGYSIIESTPLGKCVGVGYFLFPEFWSNGYATEAMQEVVRFAFEDNNVFRFEAGCIKENTGSEKIMIKCGMVKEAVFKNCTWHNGVMKDRASYRLLKSEWVK